MLFDVERLSFSLGFIHVNCSGKHQQYGNAIDAQTDCLQNINLEVISALTVSSDNGAAREKKGRNQSSF